MLELLAVTGALKGSANYCAGTLTAPKSGLARTVPLAEQVADSLKGAAGY